MRKEMLSPDVDFRKDYVLCRVCGEEPAVNSIAVMSEEEGMISDVPMCKKCIKEYDAPESNLCVKCGKDHDLTKYRLVNGDYVNQGEALVCGTCLDDFMEETEYDLIKVKTL